MKYSEICKLTGRKYYESYPISQGKKQCSRCHETKNLDGFCKNRKYSDGYHTWCIDCTIKINDDRAIQEKLAKPKWIPFKHTKEVAELKSKAKNLTESTGILHSICHIDPIQHWLICGLNIPANTYTDTQENNANSSNWFVPYRIDEDGIMEHIELSTEFIVNAFNFTEKFNKARNKQYRKWREERTAA